MKPIHLSTRIIYPAIVVIALLSWQWITPVAAQTDLERPNRIGEHVNDYTNLLLPDAERDMAGLLNQLKRESGIDITLVTVDTWTVYDELSSIRFARLLYQDWNLGSSNRTTGVLILVTERESVIEVVIEAPTDPQLQAEIEQMIAETMRPLFEQGEYELGLINGMTALSVALTTPTEQDIEVQNNFQLILSRVLPILIGVVIVGAFLVIWLQGFLTTESKKCDKCGGRLVVPNDVQLKPLLTAGQWQERELGSAHFQVTSCTGCNETTVKRIVSEFTSYQPCPVCNYRTLAASKTLTKQPTIHEEGEELVIYTCQFCEYKAGRPNSLPKVQDSAPR